MPIYQQDAVTSTANSTSTPLDDGQTFTGTGELNGHPDVLVTVKTDQDATLYTDFSPDGTNWDSSLTFTVTAGINEIHRLVKGARYFRVRLANSSGSNQTYLRLHTSYGTFSLLTAPRNLTVGTDNDTALVRPTDFRLDQALGRYTGESFRRKFGYNSNVTNAAKEVVSGLSTSSFGGFLQTATAVRIKAGGDVADTAAGAGARSVTVEGLDANFDAVSETITTNGASASSATSATFIRVLRAYVATAGTYHGSNTAGITIENSTGGTDLILIEAGEGQSESAFDTVPAGYTVYLTNLRVDVESSKSVTVWLYQCQNADDITVPVSPKRQILRLPGLTEHSEHPFTQYVAIPEKSDIWVEALGPSGGASIAVGFEMLRVQNG